MTLALMLLLVFFTVFVIYKAVVLDIAEWILYKNKWPKTFRRVSSREPYLVRQEHLDMLDLTYHVSPSVVQDVAVFLWPKSVDTV